MQRQLLAAENSSTWDEHDPPVVISRPFVLPAWAMSLLFHVACFVALALAVRTPVRQAAIEPERSVGIVLTQRNVRNERVYFQEATEPTHANQTEVASAASTTSDLEHALPSASQAPPLDVASALPTADGPVARENALADVTLTGKGRANLYSREGEEAIIAADLAAQRSRGGPAGPPTQVELFGSAPAVGRSFVFVIDRSQSMGETGLGVLKAAESELAQALTTLRSNHTFQVIAYNKAPLAFQPRGLVPADAEMKERALNFLRGLSALGGTGHYLALLTALRLEPEVIFLLTDGGDPRLTRPEVDELARRAQGRTSIVCLQFGFGPLPEHSEVMRSLAEKTGGSYSYINMAQRPR